ncbi:hypothetical protein JHK82_033920 [Glycine max]|nr:hypothetical protein JHK82_033920 [Glycine max]
MNMGAQFHMECPKATCLNGMNKHRPQFGTYPLTITSKSFLTTNISCAHAPITFSSIPLQSCHIEDKGERKIWK